MKNQKGWKKAVSFVFALGVTAGLLSNNAGSLLQGGLKAAAAEETSDKDVRTVMVYMCGSDLESDQGSATFNLHQILNSDFGKNDDVNVIVMTGGAYQWQTESELLYDPATGASPEEIDCEYNQIWEAKGVSDKDNPGQLVLLDGDGLSGNGENAKTYVDEPMNDPETLKAFINYSAEKFPAEKYDLILWDHGGGTNAGFGHDERLGGSAMMSFAGLLDAFSDNAVTKDGGKFDFIDFDACLMSSVDLTLAFADYTDYYIASPELEPGSGQNYKGWLDAVGENARVDTYELGKTIVDDMIAFYEDEENVNDYGQAATLTVVDTKKLLESDFVSAMSEFAKNMRDDLEKPNKDGDYYFYDELFAWDSAIMYGVAGGEESDYYDLGVVMNVLSGNLINFIDGNDITTYTETAKRVLAVLNDPEIFYAKGTENVAVEEPVVYVDENGDYAAALFGTSGIYLSAINQGMKKETIRYFTALDDALEKMNDGPSKDFLKDYAAVLNDYAIVSEVGYAVSALSDGGVKSDDIGYDAIRDYWNEGYVPEGETESAVWSTVSFFLDRREGGEEAAKAWLEPYIRQIANEAISTDNISVQIVEGANEKHIVVNTENISKRIVDDVSLVYTAELPVAEAYLNSEDMAPFKEYLNAGLVLGSRDADVEFNVEGGENYFQNLFDWFDDKSTTWEIKSAENDWFAVGDENGDLHVASIDVLADDIVSTHNVAIDEDGVNYRVDTIFLGSDLAAIVIYSPDMSSKTEILVGNFTGELELYPITIVNIEKYAFFIPISKTPFTLNEENADIIELVYTNVDNISDIEDIDGDGSAITEALVITDMYKYSFDLTDKLENPTGTLISIADAEVQSAKYDGSEKRPVVTYGDKTLTEGEDYFIYSYDALDSFAEAGDYEIVVYGKGEYGGSMELYFEIVDDTDFATKEEFGNMAKTDYEKKNGTAVTPETIRNTDGTVSVALTDEDDNILDVYTVDAKTGVGKNEAGEKVDLPQTGMSGAHKAAAGLAALMTLAGFALIKKSGKEDEE